MKWLQDLLSCQKVKLSTFFTLFCTVITIVHIVKPMSNVLTISFCFLSHIEWPSGKVYLLFYLQISERRYISYLLEYCLFLWFTKKLYISKYKLKCNDIWNYFFECSLLNICNIETCSFSMLNLYIVKSRCISYTFPCEITLYWHLIN